jgi:hypothetical protein
MLARPENIEKIEHLHKIGIHFGYSREVPQKTKNRITIRYYILLLNLPYILS